ncbi:hypoxia-inducible factor 1-alpha inhibitor-like [Corticium candelabrum]|uniref:hypoxia-inducible factor 1-alpha inhibitor-like n=1 Tax=Corticium candelabrum TaxID=121492 RepID=UPI002E26E759|nr:hypoxia-inducible factor 1-alpha inhibitor-like [Corticium candelabrum]
MMGRNRVFCLIFCILLVVSIQTGLCESSSASSRLLEEKKVLQLQVKALREEVSLRSAGKQGTRTSSCGYVEKQVKSMQTAADEKDEEIAFLKEQLRHVKHSLSEMHGASCAQKVNGRYGNTGQGSGRVTFKGKYAFIVEPMERRRFDDPQTMEHILQGKPVVITDSELTRSAIMKWDLDYLGRELNDQYVRMFVSPNRQFRYHSNMNNTQYYEWISPYETRTGTFSTFVETVRQLDKADNGSRAYFQFLLNDLNLTRNLDEDVASFNWNWLHDSLLHKVAWGELKHNLLLVGMPDVATPVHYDGMENLFAMISGHKRCILFSPSQYRSLYPFPAHHPHDRQSQVDFDNPNFDMFPRFREAHGYETILAPGEVLYIPSYWWHYIESEENSMTVSLNFWFEPEWEKESNGKEDSDEEGIKGEPPKEVEELILKREIEMMIAEATHPSKVAEILKEILDKRYDFIERKRYWQ